MDEERFRAAHSDYARLKRGDVLTIDSMYVEEEQNYSKKKKRKIRKMALMLKCRQLMNTSSPGGYELRSVETQNASNPWYQSDMRMVEVEESVVKSAYTRIDVKWN